MFRLLFCFLLLVGLINAKDIRLRRGHVYRNAKPIVLNTGDRLFGRNATLLCRPRERGITFSGKRIRMSGPLTVMGANYPTTKEDKMNILVMIADSEDVVIRDLKVLAGENPGVRAVNPGYMSRCKNITILDSEFSGSTRSNGMEGNNCQDVWLTRCKFNKNWLGGLKLNRHCRNWFLNSCEASHNGVDDGKTHVGFHLSGYGISAINCLAQHNGSDGCIIKNTKNREEYGERTGVTVSSSTFSHNGMSGVRVHQTSDSSAMFGISLIGNRYLENKIAGISLTGSGANVVGGLIYKCERGLNCQNAGVATIRDITIVACSNANVVDKGENSSVFYRDVESYAFDVLVTPKEDWSSATAITENHLDTDSEMSNERNRKRFRGIRTH